MPCLLALGAASQVHATDFSENYTKEYLKKEEDIISYVNNNEADQYKFYLSSNLIFSPSSVSSWTDSASLVTGGGLIFTSEDTKLLASICFQNGKSAVFDQQTYLAFESLHNLSFCNQNVSSSGAAINLGSGGDLYISGIKNTENTAETPDILFSGNKTSSVYGGAIYSDYDTDSIIEFSDNGSIAFIGNAVLSSSYAAYGGAIFSQTVKVVHNDGNILFQNNIANAIPVLQSSYGGAIYGNNVDISYNAGNVTFSSNEVKSTYTSSYGGAIQANQSLSISHNEGAVTFTNNSCISGSDATGEDQAYGGALYGFAGVNITHNKKGVSFCNNKTVATYYAKGGAVCGGLNISYNSNGIEFDNNSATSYNSFGETHAYGGAICGGVAALYNTGDIKFSFNTARATCSDGYHRAFARAYGGAVAGGASILNHTGNIYFNNNSVSASKSSKETYATYSYGGAIYGGSDICYNLGDVCISDNYSSSNSNHGTSSYGGAIYAEADICISHNEGNISFLNNQSSSYSSDTDGKFLDTACTYGGAISGYSETTIDISHNTGNVLFQKNSVLASSSSNDSYTYGGAIYTDGNLRIIGNGSVTFEKNYEKNGDTYQLRSIYIDSSSSENKLDLAANEGTDITFYDSIYVGANTTVNLNADYINENDIVHQSTGNIIFSGATTENDLYSIKGGVYGTEQEIQASRLSEINAMTNLYGGTLRIEAGAVYKSAGITVWADSLASVSVKEASLNVEGYALTLHAGTTLELEEASLIHGDVIMMSSSILSLYSSAIISGDLTLGLNMQLAGNIVDDILNLREGEQITLISGLESAYIQNANSISSLEYNTKVEDWTIDAANCFINFTDTPELKLHFDSHSGNLSIYHTHLIPEPTTVTLSLLALAGLAARRRK